MPIKPKKKPNFFVWLRSQLRSISRKHPPIYEALAAAKRPYVGDNPRQKICYECAKCLNTFNAKEIAVDHRIDCGTLTCWEDVQGFMERLFCGKEGLDVLCHTCHDVKSYMSKHNVSEKEAILLKEVIRVFKEESKDDIIQFILDFSFIKEYNVKTEKDRKKAVEEIFRFAEEE